MQNLLSLWAHNPHFSARESVPICWFGRRSVIVLSKHLSLVRCEHKSVLGIEVKATKDSLNHMGYQSEFFECAFGPLASHPLPLFFPPLSPSGPVPSLTSFPSSLPPFIPPFFLPEKYYCTYIYFRISFRIAK